MASKHLPAVAADFDNVIALLKKRRIVPNDPPSGMITNARAIHARLYSLILWRFRLRRLPVHSRVFLDEIASDALQILPQTMLGYDKTAKLLIRGILENTFRHVYFHDHPIEFERMNREKWYLTQDQLFEYAKNHPDFIESETRYSALQHLRNDYAECSEVIHGSSVRYMEMRTALKKITYRDEQARKQVELVRRCSRAVNFILAIFHRERMLKFIHSDRRIILRSMPADARRAWSEHRSA